ncbi:hypothetical protein [Endozoicomonas numazuensis]|uniref:Uncharacterized protein n=1 Tax=Endozoicomonas numazuensis TaxID=1137799 RepID=A0A081N3X8_9GAMM|nr:hypothetical protein [Endozoicomonas numazuensis]KEQ13151.1 hypothetical protein GZ78_26770 [Endozoicomonas numazuensis]
MKFLLPTVSRKTVLETLFIAAMASVSKAHAFGRSVTTMGNRLGDKLSRLLIGGLHKAFPEAASKPPEKSLAARAIRFLSPENLTYVGEKIAYAPSLSASIVGGLYGASLGVYEACCEYDFLTHEDMQNLSKKEQQSGTDSCRSRFHPDRVYAPPSY